MSDNATASDQGQRRFVRIDDSERQCPSACYKISEAICNERRRRKYHECADCEWSETGQEKLRQKAEQDKLRKRYGF
jgi:hypothetical protein